MEGEPVGDTWYPARRTEHAASIATDLIGGATAVPGATSPLGCAQCPTSCCSV